MAEYDGKQNSDLWYPIVLVSSADFKTPITGVVFGDVTIKYSRGGDTSLTTYTIATGDWKEAGEGNYWLRMGMSEFTVQAIYEVQVAEDSSLTYRFAVWARNMSLTELTISMTNLIAKLPTNNIMGSSVKTDKDDEIDAILADVTGINGDAMRGTDNGALATGLSTHDGNLSTHDGNLAVVNGNVNDIETLLGVVDGKIDVIDENVDDIETLLGVVDGKVDDLAVDLVTITAGVDSIQLDTTTITDNGVKLNTQGKTDVNNQVVDVLFVDPISELPVAQPPKNPTIAKSLMFPHMKLRNESQQTSSLTTVRNDADTIIAKAPFENDGVKVTSEKFVSG